MKIEHPDAEQLARIIWQATMVAWGLCLGGEDYPNKRALRERMKNPQPGDMVVEASAGLRQFDCAMAVGWLTKQTREPVEIEEWDVEADGPIPDERVFYITSIDGRETRWVNAEFFPVPTKEGWWYSERWKEKAAQGMQLRENAEGG